MSKSLKLSLAMIAAAVLVLVVILVATGGNDEAEPEAAPGGSANAELLDISPSTVGRHLRATICTEQAG